MKSPISREIWEMKYRFSGGGSVPADPSPEDTLKRVARAVAQAEPPEKRAHWRRHFEAALKDFRFLPAGRILAGAGTGRSVTLFNCFVMGRIDDDLGDIFHHLKEAALTMQQGGGIGYDFSTLRPRGARVAGVGADASGPVSFMDVWDAMCATIMSAGARRGAMMATLACDHPDIEEFIAAKRDPRRLRCFNLSVLVSDAFMGALKADRKWNLKFEGKVYKTVRARDLWNAIMRATYDYAEPGVIFIDRINVRNNLWYAEHISATNPCGEQPLPPYGACLLGSVNLARLVRAPFEENAHIDAQELDALVRDAVRFMDNVVDVSQYPLPQQAEEARAKRRIGLGVTGLADALIFCGVRYGTQEAEALARKWLALIQRSAYLASAELAHEKGPFPLFDREKFLAGETVRGLDEDVRAAIAEHGIRNALLTSIAPTGTISLFAENVSSGIEPVFALSYTRKVLMGDGTRRKHKVRDYALELFREKFGADTALPDTFLTTTDLSPDDHIRMQAAAQAFIDSSISKTINLPEGISFEEFKDVYLRAYETGCKGCTTYRPNPVTGAVLSTDPAAAPGLFAGTAREESQVVFLSEPLDRPRELIGRTYKVRWPESDHAIYITINDIEQDGRRRPFEIFINSKNMEHYAWTVALTRMISAVFRRGGDVSFVVEELKAVFDPRGGQWMKGRYVPSLLAAIGDVIEEHMIEIGFLPPGTELQPREDEEAARAAVAGARPESGGRTERARPGRQCPRCGQPALARQENCDLCRACGYSRCG